MAKFIVINNITGVYSGPWSREEADYIQGQDGDFLHVKRVYLDDDGNISLAQQLPSMERARKERVKKMVAEQNLEEDTKKIAQTEVEKWNHHIKPTEGVPNHHNLCHYHLCVEAMEIPDLGYFNQLLGSY